MAASRVSPPYGQAAVAARRTPESTNEALRRTYGNCMPTSLPGRERHGLLPALLYNELRLRRSALRPVLNQGAIPGEDTTEVSAPGHGGSKLRGRCMMARYDCPLVQRGLVVGP